MKKNRILVTGGSGFIGTNLIENILEQNQGEVLSLDIAEPKINRHISLWKNVDIRNKMELKKSISFFEPNILIHLAARTDLNGKSIEDYDSNTTGVSNLIEVCEQINTLERVIFASSMYVCKPGYTPKDFEDYKPHTVYGESKVLTETIIKSTELNYIWSIIRPTSIWGPWFGEPYKNFFDIVLAGKYFHMGSKACNKTYGYVGNTVSQIMGILKLDALKVNEKIYYLGDYNEYNITEWADEIAFSQGIKINKIPFFVFKVAAYFGDILKVLGFSFPMTSFRLKNMTTDNVLNISLIQEVVSELPYARKYAVKQTVDWIKVSNQK